MTYLLLGLTIGIILGIFIDKYLFQIFDVCLEKFTYRESIYCTDYHLQAQALAKEFENEYNNSEEVPQLENAVGFHYYPTEEDYYDEEED